MSHGISDKVMSGIDQIKQDPYKIPLSKMNVANPYLFQSDTVSYTHLRAHET